MLGIHNKFERQQHVFCFFLLKGTVQRWTANISYLNFKGTYSLNSKKSVSAPKAKILAYPLQITDSGKPTS
jgi:hypothetical protein